MLATGFPTDFYDGVDDQGSSTIFEPVPRGKQPVVIPPLRREIETRQQTRVTDEDRDSDVVEVKPKRMISSAAPRAEKKKRGFRAFFRNLFRKLFG